MLKIRLLVGILFIAIVSFSLAETKIVKIADNHFKIFSFEKEIKFPKFPYEKVEIPENIINEISVAYIAGYDYQARFKANDLVTDKFYFFIPLEVITPVYFDIGIKENKTFMSENYGEHRVTLKVKAALTMFVFVVLLLALSIVVSRSQIIKHQKHSLMIISVLYVCFLCQALINWYMLDKIFSEYTGVIGLYVFSWFLIYATMGLIIYQLIDIKSDIRFYAVCAFVSSPFINLYFINFKSNFCLFLFIFWSISIFVMYFYKLKYRNKIISK